MAKKLTEKAKAKRALPVTPNYLIARAIRLLWLHSRERTAALKAANYSCEKCGIKRSTSKANPVKLDVHHREGVGNWKVVYDAIRCEILKDPGWLEVLCEDCHKKEHE